MQQKGRFFAPEIVLQNVTVGYGDRTVLENITTVLPAGKISVILGGSGCGKSTLLRNILGLVSLKSGTIRLGDVDLYGMTDQEAMAMRRRLGVLFQDGALLGSMPLGQNVAMPLREHTALDEGMIEEVVRMKLKLVGLEPFVHYFPRQLSGGMRKRAGLARAMALDPAILLCDEPTSGLDPITSADLDQLILELKATFPMTIVVVTHDLDSLFTIADFVVVLDKGKMLFQGSLEALKINTDPFIVRFLGRMPTRESRVIAGGAGVGGRASLASPPETTLT
ncbi:MAG: ATP-binding cassette domain-containing protein [Desulfovibrionaceae bacterium]|nr:ATP-binding cassette domain-containing protein [Desulfovibrionaceae bacterium]